jgi:hypothetical protein
MHLGTQNAASHGAASSYARARVAAHPETSFVAAARCFARPNSHKFCAHSAVKHAVESHMTQEGQFW